jgi:shikimate dehydrogenase
MNITGTTRVFFILGDPVAQVRAPEVFNALFRKHGVDAVLVPIKIASADLEGFVRHVFHAENVAGLWVTIPHKAPMLRLLDRCDPVGRVAGAVNAVRRNPDGSLEGALFDGKGFVKALDGFGIDSRSQRILVIGAGGAGMAIAAALAQRGCAALALFDADPGRAAQVASHVGGAFDMPVSAAGSADPAGYDLVINATPLGLKPVDPLPIDVARLDRSAAVVDILMKNQPTPLLKACAARGIVAHPGYEMLLQQVPEYLGFFGLHALARAVEDDASELGALMHAE